jgi:hypothetical protein
MQIVPPIAIARARRLRVIGGHVLLVVTQPRELVAKNVRIAGSPLPVSIAFVCLFLWSFAIQWILLPVDSWVLIMLPEAMLFLVAVQWVMSKRCDFAISDRSLAAGVFDAKTRGIQLELATGANKIFALSAPPALDWNALVAALPSKMQPGNVRALTRAQAILFFVVLLVAMESIGFLLKALGIH